MRQPNGKKPRSVPGMVFLLLLAAFAAAAAIFMPGLLVRAKKPAVPAAVPKSAALPDAANMEEPSLSDMMPAGEKMYKRLDFSLFDAQGKTVPLSTYSGQAVALLFFSSWSQECREEAVNLNLLLQDALESGTVCLLADRLEGEKETGEQAARFVRESGVRLPVLFDKNCALYNELGLHWIPVTLFFSPDGMLMSAVPGPGLNKETLLAHTDYARHGGFTATEEFVSDNLVTWQGSVVGSYQIVNNEVQAASTLSAKTQAAYLSYTVKKGERALFDKAYEAMQAQLYRDGLVLKQRRGNSVSEENETGSDLSILGSLMAANDQWGGYGAILRSHADALMRYAVGPGQTLRSAYDFSAGVCSPELRLCHADLNVLHTLADMDKAWQPVYENALSLVEKGRLAGSLPLYQPAYDYDTGTYAGDIVFMEENMLTLTHLAQAGMLPGDAAEALKAMLRAGKIFAAYTGDGQAAEGFAYESAAVYGLCVRLGLVLGDIDMARLALSRMEGMRIFCMGSMLNGSYSTVQSTDIDTYGVLAALCAWQELGAGALARDKDVLLFMK